MTALTKILTRAALRQCCHLWVRTGRHTFECHRCKEPGFDGSPERLAAMRARWAR